MTISLAALAQYEWVLWGGVLALGWFSFWRAITRSQRPAPPKCVGRVDDINRHRGTQ